MKPAVIIAIAVTCSVIVAMIGKQSYDQITEQTAKEKYEQFAEKADMLSNNYRNKVKEGCGDSYNLASYDVCTKKLIGNYKSDFLELIRDYGQEENQDVLLDYGVSVLNVQVAYTKLDVIGTDPFDFGRREGLK